MPTVVFSFSKLGLIDFDKEMLIMKWSRDISNVTSHQESLPLIINIGCIHWLLKEFVVFRHMCSYHPTWNITDPKVKVIIQ